MSRVSIAALAARRGAVRLRSEAGQVSWVARRYASTTRLRRQARVIRHMTLPKLPSSPRGLGSVWAVGVVRDEVDIIAATVGHLLAQGIDHVLLADNESGDGTRENLLTLSAQDPRVHVALDHERAHYQSEKVTWLAHAAWRHGADWVVPFDADELVFADELPVATWLRLQTASVIHAAFHHMVATRPTQVVDAGTEFVLDSTAAWPGKVVARSHPLLEVIPGNHGVSRVGAHASGLHIAHAIYRSPEQIARKFRQGMRAAEAGPGTWPGEHWVKGGTLDDAGVHQVWERVSEGLAEPRIAYAAVGPMVRVRPVAWTTWDPEGLIAQGR